MKRLDKVKWCLLGCLLAVLALMVIAVFAPSKPNDTLKWLANNELTSRLRERPAQEAVRKQELIEMTVEIVGAVSQQPVVLLKEKYGELYLPIWIGPLEANAISVVLEAIVVPRPLTSDLLCSIIDRLGASVDYIVVNDVKEDIFYASIILQANWTPMEIDARPSDAIAVALRAKAPIYVEKAVLDKAGIHLDRERNEYSI